MAEKFVTHFNDYLKLKEAADVSAGIGSAGRIVALTADGKLDVTMMPGHLQSLANVINAKGDLIVGDASAEPTRLPVGSPGYFIISDPTEASGYKFTKELDGGTF